ncbi:MAG: hypothetical protein QXF36_04755 [Candidatus Caldarchaeum sp.]
MDLVLDPTAAVLAMAVLFLVFYIAGSVYGKRRVAGIVRDFSEAAKARGGRLTGSRIGVSAAVVSCKDVGGFTDLSAVVTIPPFMNPLSYLVARLMGRRELVILRAKHAKTPTRSYTLVRKNTPAYRYASRWGKIVGEKEGFMFCSREQNPDIDFLEKHVSTVAGFDELYLVSVSRSLPHLQAYFFPKGPEETKALLNVLEKLI